MKKSFVEIWPLEAFFKAGYKPGIYVEEGNSTWKHNPHYHLRWWQHHAVAILHEVQMQR